MKTPSERFYSKVKVNNETGCHEWQGALFSDGYGQFRVGEGTQKMISAHRWVCQPIPKGMLVLHRCDNRKCVNREHLYFGTHKENMRDMVEKGRQNKGVNCHTAKLTDVQVKEIRSDCRPSKVIAKDYSVSRNLIGLIKRKEIWAHID